MSNSATPSYAQAAKGQSTVQSSGSQSSTTESQAPSTTSMQSRDAAPTPSTRAPSVAISTTSNEVDGSQNTRSSSVKPESLNGVDTDNVSTSDKATQQSSIPTQGTEKALNEAIPQSAERRGRGRGQTLTSQATDAGDGKKNRKGRKGKGAEKESDQTQEQEKKENLPPKQELSDAPLPTVNPWAQRAAKFTTTPSTTQSRNSSDTTMGQSSNVQEPKQRGVQNDGANAPTANGRALSGGMKGFKKDVEQPRSNGNQTSRRTAPRGFRGPNGEDRAGFEAPGPVASNTSSWPTPETAANGVKTQASVEKLENKKEENGPNKPRQKEKWVPVPYVPTVAFETPLPIRGGRGGRAGGSRGGRDGAARGNHSTNESASADRAQDNGTASGSASAAASKRQSVDISASRDTRKLQAQTTAGKPSGEVNLANSKVEIPKQNPGDSVQGAPSPTSSVRAGSLNHRVDDSAKPSHSAKENGVHHQKESNFQGQNGSNRSDRARGGARGRGGHSMVNGVAHSQSQYGQGAVGYGYPANQSVRQSNYGYTQMPYGGPYPGQTSGSHHRSRPSSGNNRAQGAGRHQSARAGSFQPVGMYDPTAYQQGAPSFNYTDPQHILHVIASQMDYYFSIDNLCKDTYLRQHMDSQGFVPLAIITAFKRMQNIAQDYQVVRIACEHSPHVQLVVTETGEDKVRRRDKWEPWVLDMHARHPNARNDGPTSWHPWSSQYPIGQHSYYPHIFAYGSEAAPIFSPAGTDSHQFSPYLNGDNVASPTTNGVNGHASADSQLSATVPEFSPTGVSGMGTANQQGFAATDSVNDELANGTSLLNGVQNHDHVEPVGL